MKISAATIKAQRAIMEAARGRRLRQRRIPDMRHPDGETAAYGVELVRLVREMEEAVRAILAVDLPRIASEAARFNLARTDAIEDDLERTIQDLTFELGRVVPDTRARAIAKSRAERVSRFNKAQVNRQIKAVIGIDIEADVAAQAYLPSFIRENASLIKSIPSDMLKEIERIITKGAAQGLRHEQMAEQIEARFEVTESRAKLIARDQVGSLNGKLTELRQTSIGAKRYRWSTARDERVRGNPSGKYPNARPSHWDREGQIFEWANPPEGGHPGSGAINCRCTASMVAEDILENLGI